MDSPGTATAVAIVGGILLGALFAAVEAGLAALGEVRLQALRDEGGPYSKLAARALDRGGVIRARLLAGRVVAVAVAAAAAAGIGYDVDGLPAGILGALAAALIYAGCAELGVTAARQRASRDALRMLKWLYPFELLLAPLAWPLEAIGRVTTRLVPPANEGDSPRYTDLAVEHVIEQGEESGSIAEDHAELLRSVLEFKDTVAREVMVPRTQTVAIDVSTPITEVLETIVGSGHSRYPVYRERVDQIEGILYAKDLFGVVREHDDLEEVSLEELIRTPAFFAPEEQKIGTLLREMQARRVHLAIVVDEFGGTSGIVTLEDILEEIVGEIQDEHDEESMRVEELEPGRFLVDAGLSLYDLSDLLGESIHDGDGDFDSLGGLVVEVAGRVPTAGETVRVGSWDIVVREADDRHVTRVEIVRRTPEQGGEDDAGGDGEGVEAAE